MLNKLTPQKFRTLVGTMTNLIVDDVKKVEIVADLVFETAINVPLYSVAFANCSRVLTDAVRLSLNYFFHVFKLQSGHKIVH